MEDLNQQSNLLTLARKLTSPPTLYTYEWQHSKYPGQMCSGYFDPHNKKADYFGRSLPAALEQVFKQYSPGSVWCAAQCNIVSNN